jgi:hypothetical protein
MQNEMVWRKMPRNIFVNPNFGYIASCLPREYESAAYMFYLVALSVADDNGIFDLEDGVIFSRLMHVDSVEIVFKIANLMMKRKVITRSGNSTICMLLDWEYSSKEKPRTLAERRGIVQQQIEAAKAVQSKEFIFDKDNQNQEGESCQDFEINQNGQNFENHQNRQNYQNTQNSQNYENKNPGEFTENFEESSEATETAVTVDFSKTPSPDEDFSCFLNDKNQKNVTINFYDDKNQKNVVKKNETEKIREDKNREIERETHTDQNIREIERVPLQVSASTFRGQEPGGQENEEKEKGAERIPEGKMSEDISDLAEQALNTGQCEQFEKQQKRLFGVFETFFAKNYLGWNENVYRSHVLELCRRVIALSNDKNPPEIVAGCILSQFKKLSEENGYFKNMPLTPDQLLNVNTYKHVLAAVSRILMTSQDYTPEWMKQIAEVAREKELGYDGFDDEYVKYGIDPNAPNKVQLLLRAKNALKNGDKGP